MTDISFAIFIFGFLVLILLASGMWIGFALLIAGLLGSVLAGVDITAFIGATMWGSVDSFTLTAVPLFIFMGEIILKSGLSVGLYRGISRLTCFIPGSLLHSNIISCAGLAALCGTSVACAATVGTVAIPEQEGRGYQMRLVTGSLAAGGTLGILIPPSLMMIVYGAFTGNSVAKLFIGGVIPGIILAGMFMTYIFVNCVFNPSNAPPREKLGRSYLSSAIIAFKELWFIFPLVFIIWGSLYLGWATPTEAAAVGAFFALLFIMALRKLSFEIVKEACISTVGTTAFILWLLVGASMLGTALGVAKIPSQLTEFIGNLGYNRYVIWMIVVVMYIILGMFMDTFAMLVLTIPVVYPVMMKLGFNPLWFGVVLTVILEMGQITPPVGLNLYVIHGLTKEKNLSEVIKGIIPFVIIQIIMLIILTIFPELIYWLPAKMWGN